MEKGLIKETEFNTYLKALPDDAANAQWVQMDLTDAEFSEDGVMAEDETEGA
mgnify:CR=1 FL=1